MTTDWHSDLRARGYRLTPQRQLVLEAVDKLEHSTPDDILAEVRRTAGGVNISTVYRTLELLEELGLVSHAHLGHGAPTYHLADRHDHLHLVCRDCTEVIEADLSVAGPFAERLLDTFGFDTDMKHFAIFGRCGKCSAQGGGQSAEGARDAQNAQGARRAHGTGTKSAGAAKPEHGEKKGAGRSGSRRTGAASASGTASGASGARTAPGTGTATGTRARTPAQSQRRPRTARGEA